MWIQPCRPSGHSDQPVDALLLEQLDLVALAEDADLAAAELVGRVEQAHDVVPDQPSLVPASGPTRPWSKVSRAAGRASRSRVRLAGLEQRRPAPARHRRSRRRRLDLVVGDSLASSSSSAVHAAAAATVADADALGGLGGEDARRGRRSSSCVGAGRTGRWPWTRRRPGRRDDRRAKRQRGQVGQAPRPRAATRRSSSGPRWHRLCPPPPGRAPAPVGLGASGRRRPAMSGSTAATQRATRTVWASAAAGLRASRSDSTARRRALVGLRRIGLDRGLDQRLGPRLGRRLRGRAGARLRGRRRLRRGLGGGLRGRASRSARASGSGWGPVSVSRTGVGVGFGVGAAGGVIVMLPRRA